MNRVPSYGTPGRAPQRQPYGSQSGGGSGVNIPAQAPAPPTSSGGVFKKKGAVRISGPAGPASGSPSHTAAPAPPVTATPKVQDGHVLTSNTESAAPRIENVRSSSSAESSALEDLFARLNASDEKATTSPVQKPLSKPLSPTQTTQQLVSPTRRDGNNSPDDNTAPGSSVPGSPVVNTPSSKAGLMPIKEEPIDDTMNSAGAKSSDGKAVKTSQDTLVSEKSHKPVSRQYFLSDHERDFVQRAALAIKALPVDMGATAELIKSVTTKVQRPYAPSAVLEPDVVGFLKARYVETVVTFINALNKSKEPKTSAQIAEILTLGDGNFIHLCAVLADEDYINLDNLNHILALSNAMEAVVPEDDEDGKSPTSALATSSQERAEGKASWPAREERLNVPKCRTVLLTRLPENITFNKLQALVWGGRIESLQLPKPGTTTAVVKFLTPEACDKYFAATENGIALPGTKDFVFVEKTEGPNSVNDLIAACSDGQASRCVRAYDADDDWGDILLMKLATRSKAGQPKRDVDIIKRGKTARGRSYIEFRFANIYGALTFKRELSEDEDWEPCTIVYAPDPCETAQGIHVKDVDE